MTTDLVVPEVVEPLQPANLFGTQNPAEVVTRSSEIASALAGVLKSKGLAKKIGNREFVVVEGWTLLGTMLGVFPVVEWTRPVEDGWEARVEARTLNGQVVGAAEAECLRSEKNWKTRDDYALRSMAQTRAVSKALRGPLGFIVQLAGYAATPAEEMSAEEPLSEADRDAHPNAPGAGPAPSPGDASASENGRAEAMQRISAIFAELEKNVTVPEGWKDWQELIRDWMQSQFETKDLRKLSTEQLQKVGDELDSHTFPL